MVASSHRLESVAVRVRTSAAALMRWTPAEAHHAHRDPHQDSGHELHGVDPRFPGKRPRPEQGNGSSSPASYPAPKTPIGSERGEVVEQPHRGKPRWSRLPEKPRPGLEAVMTATRLIAEIVLVTCLSVGAASERRPA